MADKVQMPSSMGGLVRYFDEYKSKIELSPSVVIVLILLVVLIEVILHTYGQGWFG
ncbi:MAG: preprotein translocase subunit Sec61beta [Candidatus Woesearchaeota archaeon]